MVLPSKSHVLEYRFANCKQSPLYRFIQERPTATGGQVLDMSPNLVEEYFLEKTRDQIKGKDR
jgi:hypothetical protein